MIGSLLAVLLAVAPARAAVVRIDADAAGAARVRAAPAALSLPALAVSAPSVPATTAAPAAAPLAVLPAPAALAPLPAEPARQAAEEPATPSGRVRGLLRRLADPFGTKAAAQAPPASEAERLDRDFAALDLWGEVAPAARAEILRLRAEKPSKAELKEYVRREAAAAFERVKAARGTANIGFHYNLHGGAREDYVGSGIRASKGDIALRYTPSGDMNDKVYFFQTAVHDPYAALDAGNGEILFFPSRMGSALSVFAVDAPGLEAARADGRITNAGAISMDFHQGMRGVPYSAFLAPPLRVFAGTGKKIGVKGLTRDEETLATVRFLEAALTSGGAYIPKN